MNYLIAPGVPKKYIKIRGLSANGASLLSRVEEIASIVADQYNISQQEIKSKLRKRKYSFPRHIAMWISLRELPISLKDVAIIFGSTDHTTAIHARQTINGFLVSSSDLKEEIESVYEKVKSLKNGQE